MSVFIFALCVFFFTMPLSLGNCAFSFGNKKLKTVHETSAPKMLVTTSTCLMKHAIMGTSF